MVEMAVATQKRQGILPAKRGDPEIIRRNRLAFPLQLQSDFGVAAACTLTDAQDVHVDQPISQPAFVDGVVTRLGNPEAEFRESNHRDSNTLALNQNPERGGRALGGSR